MHAPKEAFDKTAAYVRICGCGMIVIVAYNLIGCISGDRGLQNAAFYSCDRLCLQYRRGSGAVVPVFIWELQERPVLLFLHR